MNGHVDGSHRALVEITVRPSLDGKRSKVVVWIDTAFNGHLVFPQSLIDEFDLPKEAATEAILADGSVVILESFACIVDWDGKFKVAQVISNEGQFPLLGTELLKNVVLTVDYKRSTIDVRF